MIFSPQTCGAVFALLAALGPIARAGELRAVAVSAGSGVAAEIRAGESPVFLPINGQGGLVVVQPSRSGNASAPVSYAKAEEGEGKLALVGGAASGLEISETLRALNPGLIERTVSVAALEDRRYYLDLGWRAAVEGDFYSFTGKEPASASYTPGCGGPEFGGQSLQTFPFLGYRAGDQLYGVIGDSPGMWENRSFLAFDVAGRKLSIANGDGSGARTIMIPAAVDATSVYRARFDGWQHIEMGQTQEWKSWIFASPVKSLYDVQLGAHLALANAKGFNESGLEAILRNTSYLLMRRNLLRSESDHIFISGVGYGWKQWVTDGFYMSRGLDDPKLDADAHAAIFFERINYEDNAQYYLIWSLLVKRAGGQPDMRTVERAYRFMRAHESDGLFIPPRLKADSKAFKTYHDQLPYEDDDAPSSNQGFHCGALMAAKELGFGVGEDEIEKAIAGFRRMFNPSGGYMATSLKQPEIVGQDSLYGETLTFAVFGRKLLPDEMVRAHLETTMRIQSPYGMRVISKANGDLLEGHSGSYVFGGSWFLNDGANYLDGLIHGMDAEWVDDRTLWRLEKELAFMPAFHESISTVTGKPHGHHLYSWNSGYFWLRREARKRLGLSGPDPLGKRLDEKLGIMREQGFLSLDPSSATLRPAEQASPQ